MTPTSRRMRRTRGLATASGEEDLMLSYFDLYEVQGDGRAAYDIYTAAAGSLKEETLAGQYNRLLLRQISQQSIRETATANDSPTGGVADSSSQQASQLLPNLQLLERKLQQATQQLSTKQIKRNECIMAYNRALIWQAAGDVQKCTEICLPILQPMITARLRPAEDLTVVVSRMALLLLECILTLAVGRNSGLQYYDGPSPDDIVKWIEHVDSEQDPQLKFLLALYKSRVDLAHLDQHGRHVESNIRSARKELKSAMELFQHKLRPSFGGETGSVVSSANSEEMSQQHVANPYEPQPPTGSLVLQRYNQSALSLKANLEQLKGNTKKSLILCSEAQSAAKDDGSYDAVHSNNLAVVYATNHKRQLALHALTKALRASQRDDRGFDALLAMDGTARPARTLEILHNSAICALQARNYISAYECMAACVTRSEVFRQRSRCWIRMAEACLGIFAERRNTSRGKLATIECDGISYGVVIDNSMLSDDIEIAEETLVLELGSRADLEQIRRSPLLRARAALQLVLDQSDLDPDTLASARVSLAYIMLAFHNFEQALEISQLILNDETILTQVGKGDIARRLYYKRLVATARLYAAEASCALGDTVESMKYLVGDGKDDAFDRLASDLSGVTLETAAGNGKGKRRLAKAQATVRSCACAVSAAMGNAQAAKQLANSANAMEDAYASNRERSSARRALIYALLRDGHQSPALNLLLSLR